MMQECPRCGFSQPKDKYCANCGLDIDNYHPEPTSFLSQLFSNTWFQIAVVVATIATLVSLLYWKQSDDIHQLKMGTTFSNETVKSNSNPTVKTQPAPDPLKVETEPKTISKTPSIQTPKAARVSPTLTKESKKPTESLDSKKKISTPPSRLIIEYAELSQASIQQALDIGTAVGSDSGVRALLIPWKTDISDWVKNQSGQVLPGRKLF
ncbi:hypothetical protein OAQ84_00390, partial [Bdellovibrionales bacterium]|nr:hypothetical protein [Bdellovibrionales bacterium]